MFQKLGAILPQRVAAHQIAKPLAAQQIGEEIMAAVTNLCDPSVKGRFRFLYFKNFVATLATLRPAVAQEIHLRGPEICARVNQRLAREIVKKVRVVQ